VLEGRAQVSEADRQELENSLNLAFGQAGIRYKLEIDRSLQGVKWCGQVSCRFSPSGSARLSNDYTGDEKKIIDFYSSRAEIDPAAVYIFAIGEAIDNTGGDEGGLQGKMHFDKQFGFLYNMRGNADMAVQGRTLAHEIAHGQYKLYHIFDRIYLGDEAMYSPNLMSYSSLPASNELNKMQWDILHDPGVTWGIFARDKDQEASKLLKLYPAYPDSYTVIGKSDKSLVVNSTCDRAKSLTDWFTVNRLKSDGTSNQSLWLLIQHPLKTKVEVAADCGVSLKPVVDIIKNETTHKSFFPDEKLDFNKYAYSAANFSFSHQNFEGTITATIKNSTNQSSVYLVDKSLIQNVIITETNEKYFCPGDNNKYNLKVDYSIFEVKNSKTEVTVNVYQKSDNTLLYSDISKFDASKRTGTFTWDGKMNQGSNAGKYMSLENSPYTIEMVYEGATSIKEMVLYKLVYDYVQLSKERPKLILNYDGILKSYDAKAYNTYFHYLVSATNLFVDPIAYYRKYTVDAGTWTLYKTKCDFSINIFLYYLLKKAEKEMVANDYHGIKIANSNALGRTNEEIASKRNHIAGMAIDFEPNHNPMLHDAQFYLIWLLSNYNFFNIEGTIDDMITANALFLQNVQKLKEILSVQDDRSLKNEVIARLNKYNELDNYLADKSKIQIDYVKGNGFEIELGGIQEQVAEAYSAMTQAELQTFIAEQTIPKCQAMIDKITLFETFFSNSMKPLLFLDVTYPDDCVTIETYLRNCKSDLQFAIDNYNDYLNQIETSTITPPVFSQFQTISPTLPVFAKIENAINYVLSGDQKIMYFHKINNEKNYIETFAVMGSRIIQSGQSGLNGDVVRGGLLLQNGFLSLKKSFIEKNMASGYMSWGGFYNESHDWMHFEIRQDKLKSGAKQANSQDELFKQFGDLEKMKLELEKLGITVKWNDDTKKEYLIIVKD
jgi:hypothetical protein